MTISIIEQSGGTHLLVARGSQFAIVERRNNRFYNCHAGKRDGVAADNLSAISEVVNETDWVDEATARAAFDEVISRGTGLAERML